MKYKTIFVWIVAVSGIPLLPFIFIAVPSYLLLPFNILLTIFIASLLIFGAMETIQRKQYLVLSLIILIAALFLIGFISTL